MLRAGPIGGRHRPALLPGIHTAKDAAARAEKLQVSDSPWIIVLDARSAAPTRNWVNDMCDAIGATAVWALVDPPARPRTPPGTCAPRDVEALVVHGAEFTRRPASVLGLDLPIVSLDGNRPPARLGRDALRPDRLRFHPAGHPPRRQVRSAR